MGTNNGLTSEEIAREIARRLRDCEDRRESELILTSGQLHRDLGGYPGPHHRMPMVCEQMRRAMGPDDEILESPRKGNGATLRVRYRLPRARQEAPTIRVADEIWIATALLHREQPEREDFTVEEIVQRAALENLAGIVRPGLKVHAYLHCVANRPPSPAGYRMLFATSAGTRRLYRPTDPAEPARSGKTKPRRGEIAASYEPLLDWYEREFCQRDISAAHPLDAILALRGLGKEIWYGIDGDRYVRELREGWD